MKYWLLTAVLLFTALLSFAQVAKPTFGRIQRFEKFPSKFVEPRHVDVWLPEGYDSIARKYYYNSLQKAIDYKRWEKTVTVTSHGNPISIVSTEKNGIIYALFTDYTRFDQYGNWTECRSKGEIFGEFTEQVTVRTITYFQ